MMRRVFMTRHFSRWLGKTDLSVEALCRSVEEMERGLIDANLRGGIIKNACRCRVAVKEAVHARWSQRTGQIGGSSYLGLIKNDRDNINAKELNALKALASDLLRLGVHELSAAVAAKTLQEICHEN